MGAPGPDRRTPIPPNSVVVVRRGEPDLHARLTAMGAREGVVVIWDRRQAERRTTDRRSATDRRHRDRRKPPPPTWTALGFVVAKPRPAPP